VRAIDFGIAAGSITALVGESGSGKSTVGKAIMGLHHGRTKVRGAISFHGRNLLENSSRQWRDVRGRQIALVPQDPLAGLNPLKTIGQQVGEVLFIHGLARGEQLTQRVIAALESAGLPDARERLGDYPHQFSGGQRQRILIAMALVAEPDLIIADEPTSALDVTVQRLILDNLVGNVREKNTALLLITHDLAVASDRADSVIVMNQGEIVEHERAAQLFTAPQHPYTIKLLQSAPALHSEPLIAPRVGVGNVTKPVQDLTDNRVENTGEKDTETGGTLPVVASVRAVNKTFLSASGRSVAAVQDVSLTLHSGVSYALVGESGSGKTTTARILLGLETPDSGSIQVGGQSWNTTPTRVARRALASVMQPVFQDPYSSLDPTHKIGRLITEPMRVLGGSSRAQRTARLRELLDRVRLPQDVIGRKVFELSGGQLQRVAIARALTVNPNLVVLDEPVSALDVSVQAQVLELLAELHRDAGLTYLMISHDLAVVRLICHEVAVMQQGRIVERGATTDVFEHPQHEYTRELLDAIPGREVNV
jgi:peptide/nickel transport system ATP-binding protein